MKDLNLFRKSARGSEGSTLASAVVRPSFDRRSTVVKHLAFMLLFLLGSLNVWGADQTVTWTVQNNADLGSGIGSGSITDNGGYSWNYERTLISGSSYTGNLNNGYLQIGKNGGVENLTFTTSDIPGTIKSVTVDCASYQGKHKVSITVGTTTYLASTAVPTWSNNSGGEKTGSKTGDQAVSGSISIAFTDGTRALYIKSITVVYNEGGAPDPVLESIEISGTPEKIVYEVGEEFDPTGLVATGYYDNSTSANLTSSVEWAYTPAGALTQGLTSVNVTATKGTVVGNKDVDITVNAALPKSSLIFTAACSGSGTANDGVKWTITSDAAESSFDSNRGVHYGTGSKAVSYIELTSAAFTDKIKKIEVEAAGSNTPSLSITVGGEIFGETATGITNSNVKYTFEPTPAQSGTEFTGVIVVRLAKESSANGALYVKSVVVTYESDGKEAAGLAYDATDVQKLAKVGGTLTAPALTNPNSLSVAYTSSNTDVVEVNASTGALTIKAAGKAEITASFAGNDDYKAGSATYTIFVATEAGTAEDPLSEASAKALIDNGCTLNVNVKGTVSVVGSLNTTYGSISLTLTDGFQFYGMLNTSGAQFTENPFVVGDVVTAVGNLKKHNTTYELDLNCQLVERIPFAGSKTSIANTKETAYTVAQALAYAADPTTYDLTDHVYIAGVVYQVNSFNSTNGTYNIYIKDAGTSEDDGKFEFYKCSGLYEVGGTPAQFAEGDVQIGDEVIGYGVMTYFSGGSIWEFGQPNQLVSLNRPEVSVTGVGLDQSTASIEVGETVTLHATITPDNASNKAITWTVESGDTYASVDGGVVTGLAAGVAVIRATSNADNTKYAECTVTVTAADPTKHVVTFDATVDKGESPLSKSNITLSCSNGALNNGTEYRLYKNSTTTLACSAGNITKIEFTGVSGNPVSGFGAPEVGTLVTDGDDGVWTGNAASITFTASGAQVRATEIKVTYKEDNRAEAGLAYAETAIEKHVGDEAFVNALTNPNNLTVAYESSNTDVAEVAANGTVTIKAEGATTITASFGGDEDYKPASVSYELTVNEAGLDNVTFDATIDVAETGELTLSKGGFTLTFTDGAMSNSENYRLYKGQTMTLSSTDYIIKKIEFTCSSGNPITGFGDATGLDKANNRWTGEASKVELTASGAQVRIEKMVVYYVEDTRAASGLAWSTDAVEITLGETFTAASLVNPNNIDAAEIVIESDNEDLATVNAGAVELEENVTGEATITATFAGNETYKPAEFSYTIKVNDPTPMIITNPTTYLNFGSKAQGATIDAKNLEVTLQNVAAATVAITGDGAAAFSATPMSLTGSGTIVVSASSDNQGTFSATLTISDDAGMATAKEISLSLTVTEPVVEETAVSTTSKWVAATAADLVDGAEVLITGMKDAVTYAMGADRGNNRGAVAASVDGEGVLTPGEGTMSFILEAQGDGTFALRTSNGKYLYAASSSANQLKTRAAIEDGNAKWTLTATSAIANGSNTNETIRFNGSNNPEIFSCYADETKQADIQLYVPKPAPEPEYTTVRSGLTAGRHYTICRDKKIVAVKGATFWSLSNRDEAGKTAYLVEASLPLTAGAPYIFQATADKLEVIYEGDAVGAPVENGALRGTFSDMNQAAIDAEATATGSDIYMLKDNELRKANGQTGNTMGAYKAYVVYNALSIGEPAHIQGRRVKTMPMAPQVATGVESVQTSEIRNQKVLIDGQLFILRGEKMYNANGQLVK